jgi:predicted DNA binding CopG/RHH family protein
MKKPLPKLTSDRAAEKFIAEANLTDFDLSSFRPAQFEFQPKDERLTMRLPRNLFLAIKAKAAKAGIPYQRLVRQILETAVAKMPSR